MKKYIATLILVVTLLCACSCQAAVTSPAQTQTLSEVASPLSPTPSPALSPLPHQETSEPLPDTKSTVRISNVLEDGYTLIVGNNIYMMSGDSSRHAYLYTDHPIYSVLISYIYKSSEEDSPSYYEACSYLYIPELSSGQTIQLLDPYLDYDEDNYCQKIAYTNSNGEYETFLIIGDIETNLLSLSAIEPELQGQFYDSGFYRVNESDEFYKMMMSGAFTEYVPQGLCIAKGGLGDVNSDGIEDALFCLVTDGPRIDAYEANMPLYLLVGQTDGSYIIKAINTKALYTPYRSSSHAAAGNGYIDIVYDDVDGAACHHKQVYRFWFDPQKNDWLLTEFSHQPSYNLDYTEEYPPVFVSALPDFAGLPIANFTGGEFYRSAPDWDAFDAVHEIAMPSYDTYNEIYTLAVNLNETAGTYEGYIYKYYESFESGGFRHTISGKYDGAELSIIANGEDMSFTVQNDVWKMDEHDEDAFHLEK